MIPNILYGASYKLIIKLPPSVSPPVVQAVIMDLGFSTHGGGSLCRRIAVFEADFNVSAHEQSTR